jgi:hypothetical protein
MTCLTKSSTTAPQPNQQHTSLEAAAKLIRRRANPSDADDLVDLFRSEVTSGISVSDALAGVQQWIKAESNPTTITQPTRGHTTGFAIIPAEFLKNRDFMEAIPHDLRVFLQLLKHASGGKTTAYPATKTLSNSTFIEDSSSVRRSLRNLEKKGWIQTLKPQAGRRVKTRRIVLPNNPDTSRPLLGHQPSPLYIGKEEIQKETTTTQPMQVVRSLVVNSKNSGGGFSAVKTLKRKPRTPEPTSTIVNGETLPGASKTIIRLVENLLNRANLPTDIATGILKTTKQAAAAGNIRTTADRYVGGLIGRYRDGCYVPEVELQQETSAEKLAALAKIKEAEVATENANHMQEEAKKEQLDSAKRGLTPDELNNHKDAYIEQLRQQSSLSYHRYKAAEWKSFGFQIGFDGYLRQTLLVQS